MTEQLSTEVSGAQTINESVAPLHGLIVACGPAASYMAAAAVQGFKVSSAGLQQLVARAAQAGTLDTGGQSFSRGPTWDLESYGIPSSVTTPTSESGLQATLDTALYQNKPVVLGLSNANQLTSEPPNLFGHFVTIFGKSTTGDYLTGDPNTIAASEGNFTYNSLGQLWDSDVQSITIPKESAVGGNQGLGNPIEAYTQAWFDSLGSAIGSGIASGVVKAEQGIVQDIGTAVGGWWNMILRTGVAFLGAGIFLISLDKFLGSFDMKSVTGNPGPIESYIRNQLGKAKEVATTAAEVGAVAA